MKMNYVPLLTLILIGIPTLTAAGVNTGDSVSTCESLLAAAEEAASRPYGGPEAVKLYTTAFEACDRVRLTPEFASRVSFQRGKYLHMYRSDPGAAIAVYDEALAELPAQPGVGSDLRVELLDALASALESRAARGEQDGDHDEAAEGRLRAIEVREEALAVRRQVYGPKSPEAVRGLLLLAFTHLPGEPHLAEEYASEALVIVEQEDLTPETAAETFSTLAAVYQHQGRQADATAASDRAGELFRKAFPPDANRP